MKNYVSRLGVTVSKVKSQVRLQSPSLKATEISRNCFLSSSCSYVFDMLVHRTDSKATPKHHYYDATGKLH